MNNFKHLFAVSNKITAIMNRKYDFHKTLGSMDHSKFIDPNIISKMNKAIEPIVNNIDFPKRHSTGILKH